MARVMFYNVRYLEGGDGRWLDYLFFWRRIMAYLRVRREIVDYIKSYDLDVLGIAEIDKNSFRNDMNYFENSLGMKHGIHKIKYHFIGFWKILKYLPFFKKQGNAIISKHMISEFKPLFFKEGMKRTIIKAGINLHKKVTFFLVHLALDKNSRERQLKELTAIVNKANGLVVVMGDFNLFKGEKELNYLLKTTGLKAVGHQKTFPSYHPNKKLDYFLVSPNIKVKKCKAIKLPFSDHLPIFMEFR